MEYLTQSVVLLYPFQQSTSQFNETIIIQIELYGGSEVTLVKVRSPLGSCVDYLGTWGSKDSVEWDEVPPEERDRLGLKHLVDGEFWSVNVPYFTH